MGIKGLILHHTAGYHPVEGRWLKKTEVPVGGYQCSSTAPPPVGILLNYESPSSSVWGVHYGGFVPSSSTDRRTVTLAEPLSH